MELAYVVLILGVLYIFRHLIMILFLGLIYLVGAVCAAIFVVVLVAIEYFMDIFGRK